LRAEYVVLSRDSLAGEVTVSDEDARKWYQSRADKYRQGEQRRASHILIPADKDAPAAEVQASAAKAEELRTQLKKNPDDFAKLARAHSKDPGSAEKAATWAGSRGHDGQPFERRPSSARKTRSARSSVRIFGFHIIRVTDIRPESAKPFDEVRQEIIAERKAPAAAKKIRGTAESSPTRSMSSDSRSRRRKIQVPVAQAPGWSRAASCLPRSTIPSCSRHCFRMTRSSSSAYRGDRSRSQTSPARVLA